MPLTKLERLVKEFGNSVYWNWSALTANSNISMEFIKDNPQLHWDYRIGLANNPNLDEITVIRNIETIDPVELSKWTGLTCFLIDLVIETRKAFTRFNFDEISINIHVSEIEKKIDSRLWNWEKVSYNRSLTIDFVKIHSNKNWNWEVLSKHRNITIDDIIDNPDLPWNYVHVSGNPNLTLDGMKRLPNTSWSKYLLSRNDALTVDMINYVNSLHDPQITSYWNMTIISSHRNITMKDIEDNPQILWNYGSICENPNLTVEFFKKNIQRISTQAHELSGGGYHIRNIIEFIEKIPEYNWEWTNISNSPYITPEFIERNMDKKWSYFNLSQNCQISQKYFEENMDANDYGIGWNISKLSQNCNFTVDFVKKHKDKLCFAGLSSNRFNCGRKQKIIKAIFISNSLKVPDDIKKYIIRNFV